MPDVRFLIVFFLCATIIACQPTAQNKEASQQWVFFDIKGYFEKEIQRLNRIKPTVQKKVTLNGKSEEKQLSGLDFKNELNLFIQSDINRPDWIDKYRTDSIFQENQLQSIRYTALDEKLRTRQLTIDFKNGKVSKVYAQNGGKTMVAGSQQQLTYAPSEGYFIQSLQHTAISKDRNLRVDVLFLK